MIDHELSHTKKTYPANIRIFILLMAIFSCLAMVHVQDASAKKIENDNDVTIIEPTPARPSEQPKQKTDPFTIAIIGMSLGCMCVTGAVHWNLSQKKKIEGNIQKLDSFILNNCSVNLMLAKSADNEPMFNTVQNLQENYRLEMVKNQDGNNEMVNRISGIEAEIMRILG